MNLANYTQTLKLFCPFYLFHTFHEAKKDISKTAWSKLGKLHNLHSMLTGLILATYCMRYPHAMPFLWNKMPYYLLQTPKTHAP